MKKKILAIITILVFVFAFAACGQEEQSTEVEETTQAVEENSEASDEAQHTLIINNEPYCVTPDMCDDRGYTYLICDTDSTYTFKAVNGDDRDIKWSIYLMDKKFDDETKYISENQEADLEGDGELTIKEGQYIYIWCSDNQFTSEDNVKAENSWLEINYK